jgi:two-component system invasion response regulator UvrY
MIRVVVADKNETMRLGMKTLFNRYSSRFRVWEAEDRASLMDELLKNDCNLVIIEPMLCAGAGEALIRQIRRESPAANVLVFTELDELKHGVRAIRCGAHGYLMKNSTSSELMAAVERVSSGKMHMSQALAEEVALSAWGFRQESPHEALSEREKVVFAMLVCGMSVTAIAVALNLSCKTVSTHKARTLTKMQCKNLSELVEYAFNRGLKQECEALSKVW